MALAWSITQPYTGLKASRIREVGEARMSDDNCSYLRFLLQLDSVHEIRRGDLVSLREDSILLLESI